MKRDLKNETRILQNYVESAVPGTDLAEIRLQTNFKKYTANVKLDSAHRYVEIDMIFETARFELVVVSSASQDDHFSPLRHPKGIKRRRLVEALAEGNDERQHSQGGRHHIQFTTTQTASPPMTPPGAADNHI